MVLNEMIYDPNGSKNSSLLSLVAGTISFVAGETAKHGDMKVDTPVATMGIRGTAVLVEIDFDVPLAVPNPNAPPSPGAPVLPNAKFHVLVEPDGTTGSYILYDKTTFAPLATVNQAGQQIGISQGVLSITTAPLSPEVQKLITDVFSIKFTDNVNPKIQFALGTSGNNLADLGNALRAPGDDAFDLKMPGIGKGTNSSASLVDSAAEMLFFLHEASNGSSLVEDSVASTGNLSSTGNVIFSDVSPNGALSATFALKSSTSSAHLPGFTDDVSQIGTFAVTEITADLNISTMVGWSFTVPDSDAVVQSLAMGQVLTQIYTITLNGSSQDVIVTLVGANDIPTIVSSSNDTPVFTEDSVLANHDLSAGGTITFRDVDLIDTHHAVVALKSSTSSAHLPGFTDNLSQIGKFALRSGPSGVSEISTDTGNIASVDWSFTLADNDPVLQSLAKGQTITQVYTVTIIDNNGAAVARDVTVTLVGTNDTPTITTEDVVGAVTEMVTPSGNLSDSGIISFADLDLIDVHLFSAAGTPVGTALGTLAVVKNADTTGTGSGGQLTWTYTVADSAIANLGAGQTKVESFTITLDDQNGGAVTKQIDVTITGSNDGAPISGAAPRNVKEDGAPTAGGTRTVAGGGTGQKHFHTVDAASLLGSFGSFTFDANTGVWGYTLNNAAGDVQSLTAGEVVHDRLTVTSLDGTASQVIEVTITGSNDGAAISGTTTGNVTEDGTLTAGGTLTVADADTGQNHFQAVDPASLLGSFGSFTFDANTGLWGYTPANGAGDVQSLPAGQIVHDKLTVTSTDGSAFKVIDVTITGTNDKATITGDATGSVKEDGTSATGGTLTVADIDAGENHFQTVTPASLIGKYGAFTFDANTGLWGYTLNNAAGDVQSLTAGQIVHDKLTVTSTDATASQVIEVNITGTNDPATITGGFTGTVKEDGPLTTSGTLTVADIDTGEDHFLVPASLIGKYGAFTFDASTGVWGYTLNNAAGDVQSLTAGQIVHDKLTLTSLDGTASQVIDVTITGSNDRATISGTATGNVTEDGTLTAGGTLTVDDVDTGQNHFHTVDPAILTGKYGAFTFDAISGLWGYPPNNAADNVRSLTAGQIVHDQLTVTSTDGTASKVIDVTI